jgi:hypothetical protein
LPGQRAARAGLALQHLMADACGGRYSVRNEGHLMRTGVIEGCEPFDRELAVVAIEGHEIQSAGDLGFYSMAARCARGEVVAVSLEDGSDAELPCGAEPIVPPAALAFPPL